MLASNSSKFGSVAEFELDFEVESLFPVSPEPSPGELS